MIQWDDETDKVEYALPPTWSLVLLCGIALLAYKVVTCRA